MSESERYRRESRQQQELRHHQRHGHQQQRRPHRHHEKQQQQQQQQQQQHRSGAGRDGYGIPLQPDYGGEEAFGAHAEVASSKPKIRGGGGGGGGKGGALQAPFAVTTTINTATPLPPGVRHNYNNTSIPTLSSLPHAPPCPSSVAHGGMTPEAYDAYMKAVQLGRRKARDGKKSAAVGPGEEVVRPLDRDAYGWGAAGASNQLQDQQQSRHRARPSDTPTEAAIAAPPPRIPNRRAQSIPEGGGDAGAAITNRSRSPSPYGRYEPLDREYENVQREQEQKQDRRRRSGDGGGSSSDRDRNRKGGGGQHGHGHHGGDSGEAGGRDHRSGDHHHHHHGGKTGGSGDHHYKHGGRTAYDEAVRSLAGSSDVKPQVVGWQAKSPTGSGNFTALPARRTGVNEGQMIEHLLREGFPFGLANTLVKQCVTFPLRLWLIDNSGSMLGTDGHRIVQDARNKHKVNTVDCTRWEEVTSTVTWHAQLSAALRAPTVFRLLNDPGRPHRQQLCVGEGAAGGGDGGDNRDGGAGHGGGGRHHTHTSAEWNDDVKAVRETLLKSRPLGTSNLTQHLQEIQESVSIMAPDLTARGQKVAIVVVTDGLPTDDRGNESEDVNEEFMDALRTFAGLPAWVVIRLSTDEERVVEFYNDIEHRMSAGSATAEDDPKLDVDVLDDLIGEAIEVHGHNPWLTYSLTLHLCRETGMNMDVFDAIDERPLTPPEVKELCSLLFDVQDDRDNPTAASATAGWESLPDPQTDWYGFSRALRLVVGNEREQWNPILGKATPWIDFRELDRIYGSSGVVGGVGGHGAAAASRGCGCTVS